MTDVYGGSVPSNLPSPTTVGGEWVPGPGFPAEYPFYLKPIPFNTRDINAVLQSYLQANQSKIMRILYSTWNAERGAIKYQELANAVRDGEVHYQSIERFMQRVTRDYARFITGTMNPQWEAAWAKGGQIAAGPGSMIGDTGMELVQTEFMRRWMEERGAELAVRLTQSQHQALSALLRHYIAEQPLSAQELARSIRGVIGLTHNEAKAFARARAAWMMDPKLSRHQIEQRAGNYWGRLHRRRALRIARTEQAYAYNYGQFDAVRQAEAKGIFRGFRVIKMWDATMDRTCAFCAGLHGSQVGLEETYPGGTKLIENTYVPPAHPLCNCVIFYVMQQLPQVAV